MDLDPKRFGALETAVREMIAEVQPEWLTTREAAAYLRIHPETLAKWRARNKGPPCSEVSPRRYRYRRADLDAFLEQFLFESKNNDHHPQS